MFHGVKSAQTSAPKTALARPFIKLYKLNFILKRAVFGTDVFVLILPRVNNLAHRWLTVTLAVDPLPCIEISLAE
jgi:hypothetical protein